MAKEWILNSAMNRFQLNFKTVVEHAGRRIMWITPCKRSAARGKTISPAIPELRRSSTRYGVEGVEDFRYPELRLQLARGYPHSRPTVLLLKNEGLELFSKYFWNLWD